jgi:hypothetical protein
MEPMPIPDEAALAALPRDFEACARCGFLGVRAPTHQDGTWAGSGALLSARVCPRCGHEGLPVRFEAPGEYLAFLEELHGQP